MNWNGLYKREIIKENPVLGINTIELLEKTSGYLNEKENYFLRIRNSLSYLPDQYEDAALAIYSNVIYIPDDFIKASYHFFGNNFKEKYDIHTSQEIGESSHIFEIDPSGLKNKFFQMNGIDQRLHPDYYARIDDITELARTLNDLFHNDKDTIGIAIKDLLKIGRKKYWIILTDKALSGQSLLKDMERYLLLRNILYKVTGNQPMICIKAQIITQDAINAATAALKKETKIDLDSALVFTENMKINSKICELFISPKIRKQAKELCRWFAANIMLPDIRFNTMRRKSGDNLEFGYKACGLTLVDFTNCPTNSIPLLWYDNTHTDLPQKYKGPFPRVQSRMGEQKEEPVGNAWTKIADRKNEIIKILKNNLYA
jgi:hypothetical protein